MYRSFNSAAHLVREAEAGPQGNRMRRRTVLSGLAGMLLACPTRGASPGRRWYSLDKRLLPRGLGTVVLRVPPGLPAPGAIQVRLTGGSLLVRAVTLRYADGGFDRHSWDAVLHRGGGTPTVELPAGRRLVAVRVEYGRFSGGRYLQLVGAIHPPFTWMRPHSIPPAAAGNDPRQVARETRNGSS